MRLQVIVLISCLFFGVFCNGSGDDRRKLTVVKNPQCTDKMPDEKVCDDVLLVYVQADSDSERLHYLFDFSGKTSVLIAKSDKNSTLNVDWEKFIDGSTQPTIKFEPNPSYVFASVIDKLVIFNDTKDTSNYSDPLVTDAIKINPHNLQWDLVQLSESYGDNATIEMNAKYFTNGSFSIKYTVYASSDHAVELPHLFHTPQAMQIDIIAENINYTYVNPRIAMELLMVSNENKNEGNYQINRIRNLDDEFTPGIFDVYNVVSPWSNNDTRGSFLQYRPVCYTSKQRSVSSSTESRHGNPTKIDSPFIRFEYSLPMAYFGYFIEQKLNEGLNITFGMPGDGFYSQSKYIAFSYLMGIGFVPIEGLSPFVITFAAIGIGIPLLVLIVCGTYVAVKRYRD